MESNRQYKIIFMPICHLLMKLLLISQQVHVKLSFINTLLHECVKEWVKIDFWGNSEEPACIISVQIALLWQHPQGSANSSSRQNPPSFTLFYFYFFIQASHIPATVHFLSSPENSHGNEIWERERVTKKYHKSVQVRDVLDRSRERKNKQAANGGRERRISVSILIPAVFPWRGRFKYVWQTFTMNSAPMNNDQINKHHLYNMLY